MPHRLEKILKNPRALRKVLHGRTAENQAAEGLRPAAVLLLLDQGQLWFIQRARSMRHHAGQIAFPGGKHEPSDADLWHTALREANEEIGVDPQAVQPLGRLDECWTPSGYRIRPFLGWHAESLLQPRLSGEVERAFAVSVLDLLGMPTGLPWPKYPTSYGEIWGATARMLYQWLELLREA